MDIVDAPPVLTNAFALQDKRTNEKVTFTCATVDDKRKWISAIKGAASFVASFVAVDSLRCACADLMRDQMLRDMQRSKAAAPTPKR